MCNHFANCIRIKNNSRVSIIRLRIYQKVSIFSNYLYKKKLEKISKNKRKKNDNNFQRKIYEYISIIYLFTRLLHLIC